MRSRMARSIFFGALRVGRATMITVLLAGVFAVVFGAATTALAAAPGDPLRLGRVNAIDALTRVVGVEPGALVTVDNNSPAAAARALDLRVEPNRAPLTVNANAGKATNLDADQLDGRNAECPVGTQFFLGACWEEERRPQTSISTVFNAMSDCGDEGRYLPHALESREYAREFRGLSDADVLEWTQTVFSEDGLGTSGFAVSRLGGIAIEDNQALHPYRCVAPLVS